MIRFISLAILTLFLGQGQSHAQSDAIAPQEMELSRLRSKTWQLEQQLRELELKRLRREVEEREEKRLAYGELLKHYEASLEQSRPDFDGLTVLEFATQKLQGISPDNLSTFLGQYRVFRFKYMRGADVVLRKYLTSVLNWGELRSYAEGLLKPLDDLVGSITNAASAYAKALADKREYDLMDSLSEEERMGLAKCRLLNVALPECQSACKFGSDASLVQRRLFGTN